MTGAGRRLRRVGILLEKLKIFSSNDDGMSGVSKMPNLSVTQSTNGPKARNKFSDQGSYKTHI